MPDPRARSLPSVPPYSRIGVGAIVVCMGLILAGLAWAGPASTGETLMFHAAFNPDRLGVPTNLSLTAKFDSSTGTLPAPITKFLLYAPAGMGIDARGAGTCTAVVLEQRGPRGCPTNSRAGFGGGVGELELPRETVHASYTLDFFFAPEVHGQLRLLIYASTQAPAVVELVLVAKQIQAPKPYGIGFSVEVPSIATLPGASSASIESAFVSVGGSNVAYYESVHNKRRLVDLKGLLVPKRCPGGGFPTEGIVDFADGSSFTLKAAIPCPHR